MTRTRFCFLALFLSAVTRLGATPPLSTIQDVLYKADGTRFTGMIIISWGSFQASDLSNVSGNTLRLSISNGTLSVRLVPTTTAAPAQTYAVTYNTGAGVQYSETWSVPPSSTQLRVKDVRIAAGSAVAPPNLQNPVAITDVTGLQNALNIRPVQGAAFAPSRAAVINSSGSIDGAAGIATNCLHVDGTSGPCSSVVFYDNQMPAGTVDGSNTVFTLPNSPSPASSVMIFRNGILLQAATDFTISGPTLTFASGNAPQPGDTLQAWYRIVQ